MMNFNIVNHAFHIYLVPFLLKSTEYYILTLIFQIFCDRSGNSRHIKKQKLYISSLQIWNKKPLSLHISHFLCCALCMGSGHRKSYICVFFLDDPYGILFLD